MNRMLQIISLFSIVMLSSCSKSDDNAPTVRVEVAEVTIQDVPNYIETIGNVYANSIVQVRPQVQGILLNAYFKQGDYVKQGDLLYEIDPRPYKAALDQSQATLLKDQATLKLAQDTLQRYTEIANKDFISPLTFDQYKTNVKTAEAQVATDLATVEINQINLDYTKIASPIDGKISVYNIYPGNLVTVNDPVALTEIRQIAPAEIRFTVPQKDFQEVQKHQATENLKFDVFLPYENDRRFEGILYFVDNHVDLQTGTILLKGLVPNQDHVLWPGEFIRVRIFLKLQKDAIVVPFSAVQTGQKGSYVYVVQPDMTVKAVNVTPGQKLDSKITIDAGLNKGDRVVTNGQINLRNGSHIEIVKQEKTSP